MCSTSSKEFSLRHLLLRQWPSPTSSQQFMMTAFTTSPLLYQPALSSRPPRLWPSTSAPSLYSPSSSIYPPSFHGLAISTWLSIPDTHSCPPIYFPFCVCMCFCKYAADLIYTPKLLSSVCLLGFSTVWTSLVLTWVVFLHAY